MSRVHDQREQIFKNWFDSIVDNGEGIEHAPGAGMWPDGPQALRLPSRRLPEQLWFFRSQSNLGTAQTNMDTAGALQSDQTALFYGCTLVLMMETPDAKLTHLLQQSVVHVQIGDKVTDYPMLGVEPFSDLPAQQCAVRADFGAEPPADLTYKQNAELHRQADAGEADYPYAPHLPARQGFGVRLEIVDGFREAWAAHKGPKTLRMVLHTRTTRDVQ